MKKVLVTIPIWVFISCQNPQVQTETSIDNLATKPIHSSLYRNIPNEIEFSLHPKDKGSIKTKDIEIKKNDDCYCFIELTSNETIRITPSDSSVYIGLEYLKNGEIIGGDFYRIKEPETPKLYSYEINNFPETGLFSDNILTSYHSAEEFKKIRKFELRLDLTGTNAIAYTINEFNYSIIRKDKVISKGTNEGGKISSETVQNFQNLNSGDLILITDIAYSFRGEPRKRKFNYEVINIT